MKVLMLSDINSVHTKKWVKALTSKGIDIYLFSLSSPQDNFYDGMPNFQQFCFGIDGQQNAGFFKKTGYLKSVKKLRQINREYKPDVVHAHYASSYGLIGSLLHHKTFVISIWGSDIFEFPRINTINKFIIKRNLRIADYILSTSHAMAHEAKKFTSKPIEVIPFGVELDQFQRITTKESKKIILGTIKALEKIYGIDILLKAFNELLKNKEIQLDLELWITGDGTRKEELMILSKKLGIDRYVKFKGKVSNDKIPEIFSQIDISVIPSRMESFGVAAVESLACKVPVIASRIGGLPEVIEDGVTGLLFEPENYQDLCDKMVVLVKDKEKRIAFGEIGRLQMEERYNWDKNVEDMLSFYSSLR